MNNKDSLTSKYAAFALAFKTAIDEKNDEKLAQAFEEYSNSVQQQLLDTATEIKDTADSTILTQRGIRQLTSVEQKFYGGLTEAMKSSNPRQALTNFDLTIPQTVIDTVMTDIENSHPLLAAINIQNTFGSVKWIYSDNVQKLATWGKITSAITKELGETIHELEFGTNKLTAFIPVPKDLLDLGASYIDAYVRKILADALATGLEYAVIKGTGKDMPIGLSKNLEGPVSSGVYPDKTKVVLKDLSVKSYCGVVAKLAKDRNDRPRVVSLVDLIVNPVDYIEKIVPATTVLATDGSYKGNIFPFPTRVIQSEMVDQGTAVIGMLNNYPLCLSTGKEGKVEYSDQYQFLEDNRVYAIKLFGTGRAKDNNSFVFLDISKLEPLKISVSLESSTTTTTSGS